MNNERKKLNEEINRLKVLSGILNEQGVVGVDDYHKIEMRVTPPPMFRKSGGHKYDVIVTYGYDADDGGYYFVGSELKGSNKFVKAGDMDSTTTRDILAQLKNINPLGKGTVDSDNIDEDAVVNDLPSEINKLRRMAGVANPDVQGNTTLQQLLKVVNSRVKCKDGFSFSMVAGDGMHSNTDAKTGALTSVEIGYPYDPMQGKNYVFPTYIAPSHEPDYSYDDEYDYDDSEEYERPMVRRSYSDEQTVIGYVNINDVLRLVNEHGGLK